MDDLDDYILANTVAEMGITIPSESIHDLLSLPVIWDLIGEDPIEEDIYYEIYLDITRLRNGLYLVINHDLLLTQEEIASLLRGLIPSSDPFLPITGDRRLHNILEVFRFGH